jgi:hypothetical protein
MIAVKNSKKATVAKNAREESNIVVYKFLNNSSFKVLTPLTAVCLMC